MNLFTMGLLAIYKCVLYGFYFFVVFWMLVAGTCWFEDYFLSINSNNDIGSIQSISCLIFGLFCILFFWQFYCSSKRYYSRYFELVMKNSRSLKRYMDIIRDRSDFIYRKYGYLLGIPAFCFFPWLSYFIYVDSIDYSLQKSIGLDKLYSLSSDDLVSLFLVNVLILFIFIFIPIIIRLHALYKSK